MIEISSFVALGLIILVLIILKLISIVTTGVAKSHRCLVGKTVLITGGNRGIGYETALAIAARGCRLIIADIDDTEATKRNIIKLTGNPNIITKQFNLASFKSIRSLAENILKTEDRLDILINNAGIGGLGSVAYTEDGNTEIMQVNHLGPFLLTHLLIDLLKKNPGSKVIFVTSILAFANNLTVDNINKIQNISLYGYGNTKLCSVITTKILAQNLKNVNVTVNCVYPGIVKTKLYEFGKLPLFYAAFHWLVRLVFVDMYGKTAEQGAQTTLHVALSETCDDVTGKYFTDCRVFFDPPKAYDVEFCKKIFRKSEELVKIQNHEKIAFFRKDQ